MDKELFRRLVTVLESIDAKLELRVQREQKRGTRPAKWVASHVREFGEEGMPRYLLLRKSKRTVDQFDKFIGEFIVRGIIRQRNEMATGGRPAIFYVLEPGPWQDPDYNGEAQGSI